MDFSQPSHHRQITLTTGAAAGLRLSFTDVPASSTPPKGTILLLHGFPQSSHQFRHVTGPLSAAGFRVLAPDFRGHGHSSKPAAAPDWTKRQLARELFQLVHGELGIAEPVHVVGHDIGGMVAHAYAAQFAPAHVASVVWGECPLPGTTYYEAVKHSATHWHFDFHSHDPGMAAALVAGRERMYVQHFFEKLAWNHDALEPDTVGFYAAQYAMPDAMRCAFLTYRAFEEDAEHNRRWLAEKGKLAVRCVALSGEGSWAAKISGEMAREMYADVTEVVLEHCGHYLAEENPQGFVKAVLGAVEDAA